MNTALKSLILIGVVIWGFFLVEKYAPEVVPDVQGYFGDSDSERCAKFGTDIDGVRSLSYGDRIHQVVSGCW